MLMDIKERISKAPKKQWIKMIIADLICILFVIWSGYFALLFLPVVFFDSYITRYVPWAFWKRWKNPVVEWLDAIIFALVAVYFINTFFFQNYQIPTSSLEKSLLVGDFLFVSKVSYGARSPMTPLSFPLAQHTLPILNIKSYLDKPQLKYKRLAGFGEVKQNDIVVFNFPAGDTVALNIQESDYYSLCLENTQGRAGVWSNKAKYGDIVYRPVDRRENYVKRCIGLPGQTISMQNDIAYIDGKQIQDPENIQHVYYVQTDGTAIATAVFDELGISKEDQAKISAENITFADSSVVVRLGFDWNNGKTGTLYRNIFMTKEMVDKLKTRNFILSIQKRNEYLKKEGNITGMRYIQTVYPITYNQEVEWGDFPALWIPEKGKTITFDTDVDYKVAAYERCIRNYEHNDFDYRDGKVYINGKIADAYTFKFDYYFMMGDNRDNSADSRVWGFVPEDHVVGQPLFIWLSLNKDKGWFDGKIRWNRIFSSAKR